MQFTHLQIIYTCTFFHIYDIALTYFHYVMLFLIEYQFNLKVQHLLYGKEPNANHLIFIVLA